MRQILGGVLAGVAFIVLASVVVPRWRRRFFWKGTPPGPATATATLGFGILVATGALALIAGEWLGEEWSVWIVPPLLVGGTLLVIGRIVDFRQRGRRSE